MKGEKTREKIKVDKTGAWIGGASREKADQRRTPKNFKSMKKLHCIVVVAKTSSCNGGAREFKNHSILSYMAICRV
jgi:hypothetical protein